LSAQRIIDHNLLAQIKKLSIPERVLIVEDIWDSIALSNEVLPVTKTHQQDLDRRYKDYQTNPSDSLSWEEVRNRIQSML